MHSAAIHATTRMRFAFSARAFSASTNTHTAASVPKTPKVECARRITSLLVIFITSGRMFFYPKCDSAANATLTRYILSAVVVKLDISACTTHAGRRQEVRCGGINDVPEDGAERWSSIRGEPGEFHAAFNPPADVASARISESPHSIRRRGLPARSDSKFSPCRGDTE